MEALDYKYIAKLVSRAQIGDTDAFAELYAATYQRQYLYAYHYLKDVGVKRVCKNSLTYHIVP